MTIVVNAGDLLVGATFLLMAAAVVIVWLMGHPRPRVGDDQVDHVEFRDLQRRVDRLEDALGEVAASRVVWRDPDGNPIVAKPVRPGVVHSQE